MAWHGWNERTLSVQSPDPNTTEHLWDYLDLVAKWANSNNLANKIEVIITTKMKTKLPVK